jgi:hypothetical protein
MINKDVFYALDSYARAYFEENKARFAAYKDSYTAGELWVLFDQNNSSAQREANRIFLKKVAFSDEELNEIHTVCVGTFKCSFTLLRMFDVLWKFAKLAGLKPLPFVAASEEAPAFSFLKTNEMDALCTIPKKDKLRNICIDVKASKMIATNGNAIKVCSVELFDVQENTPPYFFISPKDFKKLGDGRIRCYFTDGETPAFKATDENGISTNEVKTEMEFVVYDRVLPKTVIKQGIVTFSDYKFLVKNISSQKKKERVKFAFEAGEKTVSVSLYNVEYGENKEKEVVTFETTLNAPAQFIGEIIFDRSLFADACMNWKGTLCVPKNGLGFLLMNEGEYICMIMPVGESNISKLEGCEIPYEEVLGGFIQCRPSKQKKQRKQEIVIPDSEQSKKEEEKEDIYLPAPASAGVELLPEIEKFAPPIIEETQPINLPSPPAVIFLPVRRKSARKPWKYAAVAAVLITAFFACMQTRVLYEYYLLKEQNKLLRALIKQQDTQLDFIESSLIAYYQMSSGRAPVQECEEIAYVGERGETTSNGFSVCVAFLGTMAVPTIRMNKRKLTAKHRYENLCRIAYKIILKYERGHEICEFNVFRQGYLLYVSKNICEIIDTFVLSSIVRTIQNTIRDYGGIDCELSSHFPIWMKEEYTRISTEKMWCIR